MKNILNKVTKIHLSRTLCVALAVILTVLIIASVTAKSAPGSSAAVHQEVLSGTAEAAEIETILSGAGTLEADELTAVTVPQQVTVLKYHVRNGETVAAGDPLVSVDKTSAAAAMLELNTVLTDLDVDLEAERQLTNSAYIYSTAAGRVKKIYAATGDTVTDVLYENGALMLLSLDGTMKVSFESDMKLAVGDAVTVSYSGGSEAGRIASIREGKVTVTLSDETAVYGAQTEILDESGAQIGAGEIEINSEMKVIGYYGTVDSVNVALNSKVSVGTGLITLRDTGYTADYQMLMLRRSELEEQMQKLSKLAQTGMIYAENDGIVSGVPDSAEIELLANTESASANLLAASNTGWKLVLLSAVTPIDADAPADTMPQDETLLTSNDTPPANTDPVESTPTTETTPPTEPTPPAETDPPIETPPPTETALTGTYAASLVSAGADKIYVWLAPSAVSGDAGTLDLTQLKDQMTQFGEYSFTSLDGDILLTENGETKTVKLADLKENDLLLLIFADGVVTGIVRAQRSSSAGQGGQGQMPGGGEGGMGNAGGGMSSGGAGGGMGTGGMIQQESYEQYVVDETELLYVSDQQEIALTISVDELDILSLSSGLDAQVTLDAMKGQSFSGTIARIGHESSTGDGNTKYSVTVTLPREAAMLDGMNASVKIVTATSNAAVAIPVAALVEDDGRTYVYTTYDARDDELGVLVEVETGVSDGDLVEILSGLSLGDTFYYRYADTVTYSFLTI